MADRNTTISGDLNQLGRGSEILESISDGFLALDRDWRISYVNRQAASSLGLESQDLVGQNLWKIVPRLIGTAYEEFCRKAMLQGQPQEFETQEFDTGCWYNVRAVPSAAGILVYWRDISEFKKTEALFFSGEDRYRSLIENMIDGYAWCQLVYENDQPQDFIYLAVNRSFEKLTGLTNVIGKKVSEIIPKIKETNPELFEVYGKVASTGQPQRFESYLDQLKSWFSVSVYSMGKGTFTTVFENITERKLAEEKLRRSQENYRWILETAREGVVVVDTSGVITFANPRMAEITGYPVDELIGKRGLDLVDPSEIIRCSERLEKRKQGLSEEYDVLFLHKKGSSLWLHISGTPMYDPSGKHSGNLAMFSDITRRKLAEADLIKAKAELETKVAERTQDLETFNYTISHDLQAPLRSIDGFSQAVLEDYSDKLDARGQEYLQQICESTRQMAQLIEHILKLSRIANAEIHQNEVDLSVLARDVVEELKTQQPQRQVEFNIAPGLLAHGDSQLLKTVLDNLLGNAFNFTAKRLQAKIEFGVTQQNGTPVYFVRDNGAGFDMAYADRLFKPFQRLHLKLDFPGTGIGLASVQNIIRRLGGKVWAEGEKDKGAAFYFTLQQIAS